MRYTRNWHGAAVLISMMLVAPLPVGAAKKSPSKGASAAKGKSDNTKKNTPESRLAAEFERLFKNWDADKDGDVTEDELKKYYRIRAPKTPKGAPPAEAELPKPLATLMQKVDTDQDQKISSDEFAAWVPGFAAHVLQVSQLQERIGPMQQAIAEAQAAMTGTGGASNNLLRRGIIDLEVRIRANLGQIEKLGAKNGYGEYREFLQQSLPSRSK